jgi:uncharacterized protein (DUF302 family)
MPTSTTYNATRLTYDSRYDFGQTRAGFDEQVPLLDPSVALELVVAGAPWDEVEKTITPKQGPTGLVALARLDQGSLLSLSSQPMEATLYLVGNPLIARQVIGDRAAGSLYAPFRVAVFGDQAGAHVAYDQPSSVFASLESSAIDQIAADLDGKVKAAAEAACGGVTR